MLIRLSPCFPARLYRKPDSSEAREHIQATPRYKASEIHATVGRKVVESGYIHSLYLGSRSTIFFIFFFNHRPNTPLPCLSTTYAPIVRWFLSVLPWNHLTLSSSSFKIQPTCLLWPINVSFTSIILHPTFRSLTAIKMTQHCAILLHWSYQWSWLKFVHDHLKIQHSNYFIYLDKFSLWLHST